MRNPFRGFLTLGIALTAVVALACGRGETAAPAASGAGETKASAPESSGGGAAPAATGSPIDNAKFSTVLPDGWEIMADDLAGMGMMTLAKKGTGGATGVYLKFEGNGTWDGDPMKTVTEFAAGQKGSPAEAVTVNGIPWAKTAYEAYGTKQAMLVTKHNGTKVTATIMGDADSPEVKAVLGSFKLK